MSNLWVFQNAFKYKYLAHCHETGCWHYQWISKHNIRGYSFIMDLVAAIIAFMAVRVSDVPPDSKPQYGHGKVENISGVIEALLIFVAAIWIIFEAVNKLISGEFHMEAIFLGTIVMVSAVANFIEIEDELSGNYENLTVTIHVEPA